MTILILTICEPFPLEGSKMPLLANFWRSPGWEPGGIFIITSPWIVGTEHFPRPAIAVYKSIDIDEYISRPFLSKLSLLSI